MIGISILWTGILLYLLFRNNGHLKIKRNFIVVGIVGTLIVILTKLMKAYIRPFWIDTITNDNYLGGFVLGIFVGDPFPFFPFAGYASYGILFGMAFFYQVPTKTVNLIAGVVSGAYFGGGVYLYVVRGFSNITEVSEPPVEQLNYIQVAAMIFFCTVIYNIHFLPTDHKIKHLFEGKGIRKFGIMSLSIFMFEALIGTIIKTIVIDPLFPGWSSNMAYAVLYGLTLIIIWSILIDFWEKKEFIGSWEWINRVILSHFSNNTSTRVKLSDYLIESQDRQSQ